MDKQPMDWLERLLDAKVLKEHGGWEGLTGERLFQLYHDASGFPAKQQAVVRLTRQAAHEGRSKLAADAVSAASNADDGKAQSDLVAAAISIEPAFRPLLEQLLDDIVASLGGRPDFEALGRPLEELCSDLDAAGLAPPWPGSVPPEVAFCLEASVRCYARRRWQALGQCVEHGERYAKREGSERGTALLLLFRAEAHHGLKQDAEALLALTAASGHFRSADDPLYLALSQGRLGMLLTRSVPLTDRRVTLAIAALREAWAALRQQPGETTLHSFVPYLLAAVLMTRPNPGEEVGELLDVARQLRRARWQTESDYRPVAGDLLEVLMARIAWACMQADWQQAASDLAEFCEVEAALPTEWMTVRVRAVVPLRQFFRGLGSDKRERVFTSMGTWREQAEQLTGFSQTEAKVRTDLLLVEFREDTEVAARKGEVYYCGKCRRQQEPSQGERCKVCSKITVSWHIDREAEEVAMKRWRQVNG